MTISPESAIVESKKAYLSTVGQLDKKDKLVNNPALSKRVATITGRLVTIAIEKFPYTAKWEWSVAIVDEPKVVNAWCMAGGRMAVYTGLFDKLQLTDSEFAQIMGHEISHALANHTAEKMSVAMASSIGVIAIGVAADNHGAGLAGAAAAAAVAVTLPNSRTAETEADEIGIELAARAGYDPDAAATLWQKMNALPGGKPPQFLSTHPNPENRQKTLTGLAPEMEPYYEAAGVPPTRPVQMVNATR